MQFIVFKCKVNICNQDLGGFCRERDPEGKKHIGEEEGATEPPEEELELLGGGEIRQGWCCGWMLGMQACLGNWVCLWMVVTLWERLWAQWVDLGREVGGGVERRRAGRVGGGRTRVELLLRQPHNTKRRSSALL